MPNFEEDFYCQTCGYEHRNCTCHGDPRDARIAELEATIAKLEDDLEWREKMLQSLHDQGYIVYMTGASVMPPRPDCESTFVMGSVSRFDTNTADGRESGE